MFKTVLEYLLDGSLSKKVVLGAIRNPRFSQLEKLY
jgi:hypothetical protein